MSCDRGSGCQVMRAPGVRCRAIMLFWCPAGEELSGVPDGRGGVLPTIKRPLPGSGFSPVTEESRMLGYPTSPNYNAPPPLVPQRPSQLNTMSRQASSTSTSFFLGNPSTRPMRQVSACWNRVYDDGIICCAQSLPASFSLPLTRPSVPAPVRVGGAITEQEHTEDSGSEESDKDD